MPIKTNINILSRFHAGKFFIITLVAVTALGACAGCSRQKDAETDIDRAEQEIAGNIDTDMEQKILSFSLSGTEEGRKKWDIEGESADIMSSEEVMLHSVKGKTYTDDNIITITADSGLYNKKTSDMNLKENVVATTEDGATLKTSQLNWNAQEEYVWSDEFVEVEREQLVVEGHGLKGHPNLEQVMLEKDVKVKIKPATVVVCDGPLEIDYKESVAYLNQNVRVFDERGRMSADKATVFFSKEKKEITKIIAEGNVSIKRGENTTFSDKAIYYADEGKVVLIGSPKFVVYSKPEDTFNESDTN